jgi:hypothetical protein
MANPNIVNVANIYGKTAVHTATTSAVVVVENTAGSNKVLKINALYATNSNSVDVNVSVEVYRGSTSYFICSALTLSTATTIDLLSKSIYLEEGDALRAFDDTGASVSIICSYEEIS